MMRSIWLWCSRKIYLYTIWFALLYSSTVDSTCTKCAKTMHVSWWNAPPYIYQDGGGMTGVFKDVIEKFVRRCCGDCVQFNYTYPSSIDSRKLREGIVKDGISIIVPLYGMAKNTQKYKSLPFFSVFPSPGFIYVTGLPDHSGTESAVMKTATAAWPILILVIMMAIVSGIIMWALDSYWNPEEFPPSFLKGAWEGFWWAFVSMTTVGYGDKSPRSHVARMFALVWVLVGLVTISLFTASVTTALTALSFSTDNRLNGKNIVVLRNSEAHRFAIKKNANVKPVKSFEEFHRYVKTKKDNEGIAIDGGVIDTYIAGYYKARLSEKNGIKFGSFNEHRINYGFVVKNTLTQDKISECLSRQVNINDHWITELIHERMKGLPEPERSSAEETSANLFDHSSDIYRSAIYCILGIIVVLTIAGAVWEYYFIRPKQKDKGDTEYIVPQHCNYSGVDSYDQLIQKQCEELENEMIKEVKNFLETFHTNFKDTPSKDLFFNSKGKERESTDLQKFKEIEL